MFTKLSYLIILLTAFNMNIFPQAERPKGLIKGTVVNFYTKESLPGANIRLSETQLGASADKNGEFTIKNIPAGSYNIECSFLGFETVIKTDVQVKPERISFVTIELKEQSIKMNDITVKAGYFQTDKISAIGTAGFNNQEIRRAPGAAGDVSRILMVMPSTAKVADNSNDLAVRGGSPAENGFYIDNIPVPNINHFPTEGATGGPIGLLNIDFIDNVNFISSGFSSSYGDRLSSVVDIQFREGNREETEFQLDMNMSGFGGVLEGPLPKNKGSWMFSARKSYLDLIVGAIGTGAAPRYADFQGKITYDINKDHRISLLQLFANSSIDFKKKDEIDLGQSSYGLNKNYQNTTGLNWRALWNSNLYSNTSISFSLINIEGEFRNVFSDRVVRRADNLEESFTFRNVNYLQINKYNKLEFGAEGKYELGYFDQFTASDTNRLGVIIPEILTGRNSFPLKIGAFLNYIINPVEKLSVSMGIRSDYYRLNKSVPVSPRFSVSYAVNERLKLNASTGIFFQQTPLIVLSSNKKFEELDNISALHYSAGVEYMISEDTKLTLEAYSKEYKNLPLDPADPSLSLIDNGLNTARYSSYENLATTGKAFTRGVELLIQKKLARDIYGLLSASYFRSRYQDYNGIWRDRIYDNKYIFSAIGGYKPNDEWEFSLRWTYAGGCPYTPFDENKSKALNLGIIDQSRINSERYPDYHTLNLGIEKKFFFNSQSLDLYLSIMNTYNRKNVAAYVWNSIENKKDTRFQWSIIPIIGIEYEF
ncbi:MAG: TonB-dependent receptor [Bacillota bacterium]